MYYPVQIPFILNRRFAEVIRYREEVFPSLAGFVICFWEMTPLTKQTVSIDNVIVADGCIDLVVDYEGKQIGYAGMSKTEFHYQVNSAAKYTGARLKPGAFGQLTGLPASRAMDNFLHLHTIDSAFDRDAFFALSFTKVKVQLKEYLRQLAHGKIPDNYTSLFDVLHQTPPATTRDLYQQLHFSSRQCQRQFAKHFGLTPQMVLCLIRFQKCLAVLANGQATPGEILQATSYYDQSHLIKDFKRHVGLTPFELIRRYKDDAFLQSF